MASKEPMTHATSASGVTTDFQPVGAGSNSKKCLKRKLEDARVEMIEASKDSIKKGKVMTDLERALKEATDESRKAKERSDELYGVYCGLLKEVEEEVEKEKSLKNIKREVEIIVIDDTDSEAEYDSDAETEEYNGFGCTRHCFRGVCPTCNDEETDGDPCEDCTNYATGDKEYCGHCECACTR